MRAMATFVAVARLGSLTAAARHLSRPLTSVSRELAALEDHLATTLLMRTTRQMTLTKSGSRYLEVCRRVLAEVEAAESELAGRAKVPAGLLSVTAPLAFGRLFVLDVVRDFLEAKPNVNARLVLSDQNLDLVRDNIDIAVRIGKLRNSSLRSVRAGSLRRVTCASQAYLRLHGTPQTPADVAAHDCITFTRLSGVERWNYLSARHGRRAVTPKTRLAVNTADVAVGAAVAGLGLTRVLSYQAAHAVASGQLAIVLEEFDDEVIPVHMVYPAARRPPPLARIFLKHAAAAIRARLK